MAIFGHFWAIFGPFWGPSGTPKNGHFWAKIGDFWAKIAKMGPVPIEHWCRLVNSVVLHCNVTTNQTIS